MVEPYNNQLGGQQPMNSRRKEARDALSAQTPPTTQSQTTHDDARSALGSAITQAQTREEKHVSTEDRNRAKQALGATKEEQQLPRRRRRRGSRGSKRKKNQKRRQLALEAGHHNEPPLIKEVPKPTVQKIEKPMPPKPEPVPVPPPIEKPKPVVPQVPKPTPEWEQIQQRPTSGVAPKQSHTGRFVYILIIIVIALTAGAGFGIGYYYWQTGNISFFTPEPEQTDQPDTPVIEQKNQIDIDGVLAGDIINRAGDIAREPQDELIRTILVTKTNEPITATIFLEALDTQVSGELLRSLGNEFILGVYKNDPNQLFIALEADSYPRVYAGLLEWEENMLTDLGLLLHSELPSAMGSFTDYEIANRDARVLFDDENNPVITYSFVNQSGVIITTTPDTLRGIMEAFLAGAN